MKFSLALLFSFTLISCSTFQTVNDSEDSIEASDEAESRAEDLPADAVIRAEEDDEAETPPTKPKAQAAKPLSKDKAELKERILEVEREALGDPQRKTLGLLGDLKACRMKLASKAFGGSGEMIWDEPTDRLSEKWLSNEDAEVDEFQAVLMISHHRLDYLKQELGQCNQELSAKKMDPSQSTAVNVTDGDSDNDDRVHQFVCGFVKKGASLREFLIQTFSRGILQLEDFDLSQDFLVASLQDGKNVKRPNGLMFMGWKLSFDKGPLILNDIIFNRKDSKLMYWSFSDPDKVNNAKACLPRTPGQWNP